MLSWVAAQLALAIAAALLVGRSPGSRCAASLAVLAAFAIPWIAQGTPLERGALTFLAAVGAMKVVQVALAPDRWTWRLRLWHVLEPFDVRGVRRERPAISAALLGQALLYAALCAAGVAMLLASHGVDAIPRAVLRILGAGCLAYGGAESVAALVSLGHLAFGLRVPPIHSIPILSRTVSEFWSRRWNRPVNAWLAEVVFRPIARRRRAAAALAAAFAVSALLHAWLAAPLGLVPAALVGSYFVVEGLVVIAERRMNVASWPEALARAWTLAAILAPLPLLAEPFLSALAL
jgi:hypothetical protein